jgi:hypothetical protein
LVTTTKFALDNDGIIVYNKTEFKTLKKYHKNKAYILILFIKNGKENLTWKTGKYL